MSIWCSTEAIGFDADGIDEPVGQVRSYVSGWSNHYPTTDGTAEQEAGIDTAYIAPWCVPGRQDLAEFDTEMVGPWLRLSVDAPETSIAKGDIKVGRHQHVSVVLDETAVEALVESLQRWLAYPKAQPAPANQEPDNGR